MREEERIKSEDVGKRRKADLLGLSGYGKELELNPDWQGSTRERQEWFTFLKDHSVYWL